MQVKQNQTGVEAGWMSGEMNGSEGIFPEAYVEFVEDVLPATSPEAQPAVSSPP